MQQYIIIYYYNENTIEENRGNLYCISTLIKLVDYN